MKKLLAITFATLSLVLSVPSSLAFAQAPSTAATPGSGQALEIGPPVINLVGDPGTVVKASLSLKDISANKLVVTNEIDDFTAGGEDGTPKILLNQTETNPYSIKKWISALPKFTLVPAQVQTLYFNVTIPKTASPGGYYGIIRFTGLPPGIDGTGVALSASLGALVFMKVNGTAKESVNVAEFYTGFSNGPNDTNIRHNWLFQSAPVTLVERLNNSGNIFEQPTGSVTVTDMFGKTVATEPVNAPPRNVLPGSIRKFTQILDSKAFGDKFLFGRYTATLNLTYGDSVVPISATAVFWVIPYTLLAIILVILLILFFGGRYLIRRYAQNLASQSGGRRRR